MWFDGADEQEAFVPNPGGYNYGTDGRGEENGVWGGKSAVRHEDPSKYTGAWIPPEGENSVAAPADPALFQQQAVSYSQSGRQDDVDRYRNIGQEIGRTSAAPINYDRANYSQEQANTALGWGYGDRQQAGGARQHQVGALHMMQSAAEGAAPSRAEILGRGLIDQSLKAQLAGAASARGGPLAQMAAQRQAHQGSAQFQAQGMNQLSALRADEMERARAAYGNQAGAIRGQDYGAADQANRMAGTYSQIGGQQAQQSQMQGQQDIQNRGLAQDGRLAYERMAWDTNNAALNAQMGRAQMDQSGYQFSQGLKQQQADRDQRATEAYVSAGTAGGGALLDYAGKTQEQPKSDMRAKTPLLLDLGGRRPKAAGPNFLDSYMGSEKGKEHAREEHDSRMREHHEDVVDMGDVESWDAPELAGGREDPYTPTPGGIQREDPYGSRDVYFSDDKTKLAAAWDAGHSFAAQDVERLSSMSPDQLKKASGENRLARAMLSARSPAPSPAGHVVAKEPRRGLRYSAGTPLAPSIDPYAHGVKPGAEPPRSTDMGARTVERGRPAPLPDTAVSRPKPQHDPMGETAPMGPPPAHAAPPVAPAPARAPATGDMFSMYSDKETKQAKVRDLGDVESWGTQKDTPPSMTDAIDAKQREGRRDPASFRRDDAADQKRVKRRYEDDAGRKADEMMAGMKASLGRGASVARDEGEVDDVDGRGTSQQANALRDVYPDLYKQTRNDVEADANRRLAGSMWQYKPEYAPPGEEPGQPHYGGMAQEYEKNPLTATTVRKDPRTGMRAIDMPSMVQVQGAGIASLQKQIDDLKWGRHGR